LVLNNFKPDARGLSQSDIHYEFRLTGEQDEARLLLEGHRQHRLEPFAMERLQTLGEKQNVLKQSESERQRMAPENLEQRVPPKGSRFQQMISAEQFDMKALPRGAEFILRKAYTRLLDHYKKQKDTVAAVQVGREFAPFLKVIIDREGSWYNNPLSRRG